MDGRPAQTITVVVRPPVRRGDLPGLTERVCARMRRSRPGLVVCEVSGVEPDAVAVEALARLRLAARRYGCGVRLVGASDALLGLVEVFGLGDVLER